MTDRVGYFQETTSQQPTRNDYECEANHTTLRESVRLKRGDVVVDAHLAVSSRSEPVFTSLLIPVGACTMDVDSKRGKGAGIGYYRSYLLELDSCEFVELIRKGTVQPTRALKV